MRTVCSLSNTKMRRSKAKTGADRQVFACLIKSVPLPAEYSILAILAFLMTAVITFLNIGLNTGFPFTGAGRLSWHGQLR